MKPAMKNLGVAMGLLLVLAASARAEEERAGSRTLSAEEVQAVAGRIRAEAVRANDDPEGRPLPLASHWTTGSHALSAGWGPQRQMELIEQGHFLLPWFAHPPTTADLSAASQTTFAAYYEKSIQRTRELKLPIVLVASQWEHLLSAEPYLSLPPQSNPNVVGPDGQPKPMVSPFGPVDPWRKAGATWTANPQMRKLQQWYPDPPLVIFLSNNEHAKLTWHEVQKDRRYAEKYGSDKDDDFKRKVVADGWIERYRALQQGMRDGLASPAWQKAARFVGYEAFGLPHFGRWGGWPAYSLHSPGRLSPDPLMWDGGSPSYYTHNWNPSTDFTGWSPQVEFQNLVFMQREAYRLNPAFWIELSIWDGYTGGTHIRPEKNDKRKYYEGLGQTFTPQRYGGFVQFGLWLLRPRAVREFRSWVHPWEDGRPYWMAIVEAVDRVHRQDALRAWWRKGELVPNRACPHMYQAAVPEEYRNVDRWFLLDADVNPPHPWKLSTNIPVFCLALVLGQRPGRQWLLYAHSPLADRKQVKITIPDHGPVAVDVAVGGSFHVVDEKAGSATPVR